MQGTNPAVSPALLSARWFYEDDHAIVCRSGASLSSANCVANDVQQILSGASERLA